MKLYLRTFGCRANQYDTEVVRAMAVSAGHEITDHITDADCALFNSCAVTASAEAEVRKAVRGAGRVRPGLRTVIMGCAAARSKDSLERLPTVAGVVPAADFSAVARFLQMDLPRVPAATATERQAGARALLRIQDGCDEHCTFCATTLARGASRSRPIQQLVAEAGSLARHHGEVVLTGVHIGHYGRDIGSTLGQLVEALLRAVPNARFRLSSLEATEVDSRLESLLRGADGRLTPHLHAPLQSGSDRVLRLMGRNWYTAAAYRKAVERLAAGRDIFALGADVMSGFPGETDADHEETKRLVRELPFTYLHVFPYSPRPGAAATRLRGQLPARVVDERAAELRAMGSARSNAYAAGRNGGSAQVVVIGTGGRSEGLTEDYLKVRLSDASVPRGELFSATLRVSGGVLLALQTDLPLSHDR